MANPKIKIKRSSVAGKIPTSDQVPLGEIALNTYDGYLYASKNVGIGTTVIAINPFRVGTGTDSYNTYFTAGSVGIGSTLPTSKLDVIGDTNVTGIVTAAYFHGDGSNLTGLAVTSLQYNNSSVSIATTDGSIIFKSNNVIVASISSETAYWRVPLHLNDNKITNLAAPSSLSDAANKDYVDNQVAGDFPTGDYGDLTSSESDAFGQIITSFTAFDCLITPSGSLATQDLGALT